MTLLDRIPPLLTTHRKAHANDQGGAPQNHKPKTATNGHGACVHKVAKLCDCSAWLCLDAVGSDVGASMWVSLGVCWGRE